MNVAFNEISTSDAAKILGVQKCTIALWCRQGKIRFQDVSNSGSSRPRYLFTDDEIDRVLKLIEKYGKRDWLFHNDIDDDKKTGNEYCLVDSTGIDDPEDYIPQVDETVKYVKQLRALKVQRDKMAAEIDRLIAEKTKVEESIEAMRNKIIESI
jgi:DNA-binding transcriptional MerR regulator